jgi:hypothetical protein
MKSFAAAIIVCAFVLNILSTLIYTTTDLEWQFIRSPSTGICYERYVRLAGFSLSESLNPVEDSFCELEATE